jgi:hypothetical protein
MLELDDYCYVLAKNPFIVDEIAEMSSRVVDAFSEFAGDNKVGSSRRSSWAHTWRHDSSSHSLAEKEFHQVKRDNTEGFEPESITDVWDRNHTISELTHHVTLGHHDDKIGDSAKKLAPSHGRSAKNRTLLVNRRRSDSQLAMDTSQGRSRLRSFDARRKVQVHKAHAIVEPKLPPKPQPKKSRGFDLQVAGDLNLDEDLDFDVAMEATQAAPVLTFDEFADHAHENRIFLQGHVVLIGMPYELLDFLGPLRTRGMNNSASATAALSAIVILAQEPPTRRNYEIMSMFPDVHFLHGSALDEHDLDRASVFWAQTIIHLASRPSPADAVLPDPHMVDSSTISTLKFLSDKINEQVNVGEIQVKPEIITEIVQNSNLKYLTWMLKEDRARTQGSRSRERSTSSSETIPESISVAPSGLQSSRPENAAQLDPLKSTDVASALSPILNQTQETRRRGKSGAPSFRAPSFRSALSFRSASRLEVQPVFDDSSIQMLSTADQQLAYIFHPNFAAGKVYLANLGDRLLCKSYWQPQTSSVLQTLVCGDTIQGGDYSMLSLQPVPAHLVGGTFTELFCALLEETPSRACMAIFRKGLELNSPLPYVYTNPPGNVIIHAGDRVYVVGPVPTEDEEAVHQTPARRRPPDATVATADI